MGRIAQKTTLIVGLALATVAANSGCGCDLSNIIGFPLPVSTDSVLVIVKNDAGVDVRVDATFTFSQEDVRQTSRVLDAEGAGSTTAILRTVAERIDVKATAVASNSAAVISNLITPGDLLLDITLVLNQDYVAGDTIVITIRNPIDDCNGNGVSDSEEIASGDAQDCDMNGIPDDCQPDVDGDGIIDACDNCLSIPNPDQLDADNNGLGDVCELGACNISGTCVQTTLILCTNQDGSFGGVGTDCPAGNPVPTGACCTDGACNVTTQAICEEGGGSYQGDATTCDGTTCAAAQGACCLSNNECAMLTESSCTHYEGSYQGDGTNCDTASCSPPTGACCMILVRGPRSGATCEVLSESACAQAEGDYLGDDTTCDGDPCNPPTGACCTDGTCIVVTESDCSQFDGSYQGDGSICDSGTCLVNEGACCLVDQSGSYCVEIGEGLCNKLGGEYNGDGSACEFAECPAAGACCIAFTRGGLQGVTPCQVLTEAACNQFGGSYFGDGTTCADDPCNPPTGACCFFDGEVTVCGEYPQIACDALHGYYHGDDTTCQSFSCDSVVGACCINADVCYEIPEESCLGLAGTFRGVGTTCQATCFSTGACCLLDDSCMNLTETSCSYMKGRFVGLGTSCDSIDCNNAIEVEVESNRTWVYENIPTMSIPPTNCTFSLSAIVANDPLGNSSYSYIWRAYPPYNAPAANVTAVSGDGTDTIVYRAPDRPGFSPTGSMHYFEVTVIGNDSGNFGTGYVGIKVRLLGDVDDSGCTNLADRQIISAVIDGQITDPTTIDAADVNCDGSVDALDSQTALYVEQNTDGHGSCITPG